MSSLTMDSITVSDETSDVTQLLYKERKSKNKQGGLSGINKPIWPIRMRKDGTKPEKKDPLVS